MRKLFILVFVAFLLSACKVSPVVKTNYSGNIGQTNHNLLYYYLPETLLSISVTSRVASYYVDDVLDTAIVIGRTYTVVPKTIADTKDILILEYNKNNVYSDELGFGVNEKGLLTTLKIQAEDQTAAIIEDITKALIEVAKPVQKGLKSTDVTIAEYSRTFTIKASDVNQKGKEIYWRIEVKNEKNPKKESFKLEDSFTVSTPDNGLEPFKLESLQADIKADKTVYGILTRPIRNLNIVIKPKAEDKTDYSDYVQISDPSKLLVLPISRTAFTATTNNLTITDGIVRANDIKRPSPIRGFVQIPINIAKAVVSIPAQLIQIRINKNSDTDKLQTSEIARLNAELKYRKDLEKINANLDSLNRKR